MALRKAILWSVGGQTASYLILFVGSVLVARLLSPREMGVFAIAMATIGILNTLMGFNISAYIVREPELKDETISTAFTLNAIIGSAIAVTIVSCGLFERYVANSPDVARVLYPLALTPLIGIFEFRAATMLQREMNFRIISIIQACRGLITTSIVIFLAYNGYSFMSLAYGNVIAALINVVWTNSVAPHHSSFRLSLAGASSMLKFGLRLITVGSFTSLSSRFSDIILGQLLGLASLGLYSRASSISTLVLENIYGAVTRVVFVQLSDDYRNGRSVRYTFVRSFRLILCLLWPVQIGLAIMSGPFIYHLYGERWLPAAVPLSMLMVAQCLILTFGMNWELFVLNDEIARQTRLEALKSVAGLVFFAVGCLFNIAAASAGRIVEALFGIILYRPHMERLAEVEPGYFTKVFLQSALLTASATAPALALMMVNRWRPEVPIASMIFSIFGGGLLWLATLAFMKHPMMDEFALIARKVAPRN